MPRQRQLPDRSFLYPLTPMLAAALFISGAGCSGSEDTGQSETTTAGAEQTTRTTTTADRSGFSEGFPEESLANEQVLEVADGVYAFDPQDGYTSLFVVTDDGVIAIEPVNSQHATGFLEAIKSVTEQPVKYLLPSHNHWDHASGGGVFREAGATITVHEKAFEWMEANPGQDTVLPDESWSGGRKDITLGGTTLQLHYMGMNHGLGMTIFLLPEENVVYVADLVTPNRILFAIVPDFNIGEWVRTLNEIEALDFDAAVFSHSNSDTPIGTKQDVVSSREFITDLQGAIEAEFQKGTNPFAIASTVKLPKYEGWAGYDEWFEMNAWRVMLDMWMGPFPWQP